MALLSFVGLGVRPATNRAALAGRGSRSGKPAIAIVALISLAASLPQATAQVVDAAVTKAAATSRAAARVEWPSQVHASYQVAFNGMDVGRFDFQSSITGSSYTLTGNAELSALLGAFSWRGATRSFGTIAGENARPQSYLFDFAGTGKSGSLKMSFADNAVSGVTAVPTIPPTADTVPLTLAHLKGALDPLTAVIALSRGGTSPCARRVPVFDGKQRFDLVLSYKGQEGVREAQPSGQPGVAIVCRVKYVPIAGHKLNAETRAMAESTGIEIAFRPVPTAGLFVPHRITIPTGAGTASLTSTRISIVTAKRNQIAFVH
ncbi:MAG TPA: DUF3108 domain-containing protein [Hyphomicrobiaceae bacterium]|nr:DUF3108 domain-containing protein [Hyphomicrobiaceae bacterium]